MKFLEKFETTLAVTEVKQSHLAHFLLVGRRRGDGILFYPRFVGH